MSKIQKLLLKILRGTSDSNIEFEELRTLLLFWDSMKELKEVIIFLQKIMSLKSLTYNHLEIRLKITK